ADAAAVRRVAEVTGIVELAVEAAAGARQALKHVVDRAEAGLGDVLLVDEHARGIEVERITTNARAGDHDLTAVCGARRLRCRGCRCIRWRKRTLRLCRGSSANQRRKCHARAKCRMCPDHYSPPCCPPVENGSATTVTYALGG